MKIYGTTVTTPFKLEKIAAGGSSVIYYKEETQIDQFGYAGIKYPMDHDWTQEFSAVPQIGDMVISASKQLFKVEFVSNREVKMFYLMDLQGEAAVPEDKRQLTGWTITENGDTVTLNYTLEGNDAHTDVITFDENGHPTSINHDGFVAEGTWTEAASDE